MTTVKTKKKTAAKAKPAKKTAAKKTVKKAAAHRHKTVKAKVSKKAKVAVKAPAKHGMDENQKTQLLYLIDRVILLRKHAPDGLRSFNAIDRIMDRYNQKYIHPEDKFDVIVKYGVEKYNAHTHPHKEIYVFDLQPDEMNLYHLLSDIEHEKSKFDDIKNKLEKLYEAK